MCGLAGAAGDAATVGVTEQAGCERLVLELDVVADEEGFQRLEVAVGAGVGGAPRAARRRCRGGRRPARCRRRRRRGSRVGVRRRCRSRLRCRACSRSASARRSRCRARLCAPGSRPCSRRGSPCTQVASGRCAKIRNWLASEYLEKRLMVVSSGSSEVPGWARLSLSVVRRLSIELRASVFIWEAPFLSRDPTVPSPVVRGTVGDRRGSRRRRPPTAPETRQGQGA